MISPWRKSRWRWAEATHSTPGVERPRSVGTWSERVEAAGATGAFYLDTCGRLGRRDERAQVALRYTSRSLVSAPAVHHRVSRWRRTCRRWRGALLSRSRGGANGTKNPVGCHFWRANEEGSKLFRRTITRALTLACRYRGMHVDSAGSNRLSVNDGRDMHQVCIALVNPAFPLVARGSRDDDEAYWEEELKEWSHITTFRWGWNTSRQQTRSSFSSERAVKALLSV